MFWNNLEFVADLGRTPYPQSITEYLLRHGMITEDGLFHLMTSLSGAQLIGEDEVLDRAQSAANPKLLELVPKALARATVMYPIGVWSGTLHVAAMDPTHTAGLALMQVLVGAANIRPLVARRSAVLDAIDTAYGALEFEGEPTGVWDDAPTNVRKIPAFLVDDNDGGTELVTKALPLLRVNDLMRPLSEPLEPARSLRLHTLCLLRSDSAAEALIRLQAHDEPLAIVVDEDDEPLGTVAIKDLVRGLVESGMPTPDA